METRFTRTADVDPRTLTPHPRNWRTHPASQLAAIGDALDTVGWIDRIIVNERTGYMINGHARQKVAIDRSEPTVPVAYVDLDEDKELLAIASFDRLTVVAGEDDEILRALLDDVRAPDGALAELLESARPADPPLPPAEFPAFGEDIAVEHRCPKCGYEWSGGE